MITEILLFVLSFIKTNGDPLSFLLEKILLGEILLGTKKLFFEAAIIVPLLSITASSLAFLSIDNSFNI